ncbi:MAG: adenylate/guanylate cyclase domain-containing protein [Elusimicrobiales bacterium]|nr:adenylate/guanylate cyclase domain-containing protein [Elusimicrobiales bacterium]
MKKLSKLLEKFHKLHLGLYVLFSLMVYFGGVTGYLFERFSLIDTALLEQEWEHNRGLRAKGEKYTPPKDIAKKIFKPLNLTERITYRRKDGKTEKLVTYSDRQEIRWYYFLFLAAWLWPLYRYNFSKKPQDLRVIERRIIHLPVVILALGWVIALQHYFVKAAAYAAQYGPLPGKVTAVLIVSSLLFVAFVSYLNLELTGLYIRRRIARPFFLATNPYGLKQGFAINLTLRYALMIFSLAMVPLLLSLYMPVITNLEVFAQLKGAAGPDRLWAVGYDLIRTLIPIVIVSALTVIITAFQLISIILYRYNVHAPAGALVERMKAVAGGDFNCKTSVLYADELGQLKGHFNMMLDGLVERDHIKDTFGRYVSLEIAEKIMKSGKVNLAGEEIQATVLFSDIRGFTPLSEKLPPVELIRFLNEYFTYITKPIADNKGVINKFIGDAVMAIFSPVFGVEDHRAAGLRAALGMREALKRFNAQKRYPEVFFGVGLHSGGLVAGNVGTESRLEYTVLGDTVNVASRIESQTKISATQLLASEDVVLGLDKSQFPGVAFLEGAPVLMKGKSKPMVLYRVEPVSGA